MNVVLEILIQYDTNVDVKLYLCQIPILHGPVISLYILKTIWWTNVRIGILVQCDAVIYLILCMWVSYLHFMVQWFCLISWRRFDGEMLYWRYWFSATVLVFLFVFEIFQYKTISIYNSIFCFVETSTNMKVRPYSCVYTYGPTRIYHTVWTVCEQSEYPCNMYVILNAYHNIGNIWPS